MRRLVLAAFLIGIPFAAEAHPTSFAGSFAVMTFHQPHMSDLWLIYSFSPRLALAARGMRMEMPEGQALAYFPQVDFLAFRENGEGYQANAYVYGGYGGGQFQNAYGQAGVAGVELDAESRKLFALARWEYNYSNQFSPSHRGEFRIGLAPYEAEFNELAAWIMLQYQVTPALTKSNLLTPMVRLFYRGIMWEIGASVRGDWMLNFMAHF